MSPEIELPSSRFSMRQFFQVPTSSLDGLRLRTTIPILVLQAAFLLESVDRNKEKIGAIWGRRPNLSTQKRRGECPESLQRDMVSVNTDDEAVSFRFSLPVFFFCCCELTFHSKGASCSCNSCIFCVFVNGEAVPLYQRLNEETEGFLQPPRADRGAALVSWERSLGGSCQPAASWSRANPGQSRGKGRGAVIYTGTETRIKLLSITSDAQQLMTLHHDSFHNNEPRFVPEFSGSLTYRRMKDQVNR
ncbi:hypothetical protein XENOCAPTIV_017834 [Xenoophorus captivus]|uniref:Uncharacterized protein n=1 Tax=Xenoophorus captivus TaxID=1517983 RepID=A0ABV0QIV9_9TELE